MQARLLRDYLRRVEAKVRELEPLILSSQMQVEWRAPNRLVLKGMITFIDASKLYFLEYLFSEESSLERISYGFHYSGPNGRMIFRYDNAPHHPEVPTYPHHKHLTDGKVVPSREKTLPDVLDEIGKRLSTVSKRVL